MATRDIGDDLSSAYSYAIRHDAILTPNAYCSVIQVMDEEWWMGEEMDGGRQSRWKDGRNKQLTSRQHQHNEKR